MTLDFDSSTPQNNVWIMRAINTVSAITPSKCCFYFTLRQGTILIAVMELALTSIAFFLLLLGATHLQDILDMVSYDIKELENNPLLTDDHENSSIYLVNNEMKMLNGKFLATIMMTLIYTGLVVVTVHLICCILLLYGAIHNSPNFIIPWSSSILLNLILSGFLLFLISFFPDRESKIALYTIGVFLFGVESYSWFVVFSYYCELKY